MRTLAATVLSNAKGKYIYCFSKRISDQQARIVRETGQEELENAGFTFIRLVSPDFSNVRGHAIFFEGHLDEMLKAIKGLPRY